MSAFVSSLLLAGTYDLFPRCEQFDNQQKKVFFAVQCTYIPDLPSPEQEHPSNVYLAASRQNSIFSFVTSLKWS